MRADQLIGRLALRERPTNGDESYMESPVRIIRVMGDFVFYAPYGFEDSYKDCPCSMKGWLDGWKPADCGGKKIVSLMSGSIWLTIEETEIEAAVDEIQYIGGFRIISAGHGEVFAAKDYNDSDQAIKKIKELVRLGWVWE